MRGKCNSAVERIIAYDITRDEIVTRSRGVIGDQDSTRILFNQIVRNDGVIRSQQVDALATIVTLYRFERRQSRTSRRGYHQGLIVGGDDAVGYRDRCRIRDEDTLKISVPHGKPANRDTVQTWIVDAIHKDAIGQTSRINDCVLRICADEGQAFADNDVLIVGSLCDLDGIGDPGGRDCGCYRCEASAPSRRVDAERGGARGLRSSEDYPNSKSDRSLFPNSKTIRTRLHSSLP